MVAAPQRVLDEPRGIVDVVAQPDAPGRCLVGQLVRCRAVDAMGGQQQVLVGQDPVEPVAHDRPVEQVFHPQPDPQRPVGVGRADPPPRRPDLAVAEAGLHRPVQGHVVRHDHVRRAAHPNPRHVDPARDQHVELGDQGGRVDDDPGADDRGDVRVQHARRDEVQLEDLVAADDRVAGVVATLVADDHRHLLGQEVRRLALALVAPLEPDDHGGRH